jgi:hypothetical protein
MLRVYSSLSLVSEMNVWNAEEKVRGKELTVVWGEENGWNEGTV